jgi:preprotein translocase subunit SecD
MALAACGHHHRGEACKHARDAHVAVLHVDDNSDYMKSVVAHVDNASGVHVIDDTWHTETGGVVTDHALAAPTRDALVHYVATLPPIPSDHRIVYEQEADGAWRTMYVASKPVVDGGDFAYGNLDGEGVMVELTKSATKAFATGTAAAVGHKLAIVAGDDVLSAPVVLDKMAGGAFQITVHDRSGDAPLLHRIGCARS